MTKIEIMTGRIIIDPDKCRNCSDAPCIEACLNQILKRHDSEVIPAQPAEIIKKGFCIECLACELICHLQGEQGMTIELPLPQVKDGEK